MTVLDPEVCPSIPPTYVCPLKSLDVMFPENEEERIVPLVPSAAIPPPQVCTKIIAEL